MFADLQVIIGYFRGTGGVTLQQALKAVIDLLNIAVDQMIPSAPPASGGPLAISTPEGMIQHFEKLIAQPAAGPQAMFSIPWATFLPILLQLFQQWFAGRNTPATPTTGS